MCWPTGNKPVSEWVSSQSGNNWRNTSGISSRFILTINYPRRWLLVCVCCYDGCELRWQALLSTTHSVSVPGGSVPVIMAGGHYTEGHLTRDRFCWREAAPHSKCKCSEANIIYNSFSMALCKVLRFWCLVSAGAGGDCMGLQGGTGTGSMAPLAFTLDDLGARTPHLSVHHLVTNHS